MYVALFCTYVLQLILVGAQDNEKLREQRLQKNFVRYTGFQTMSVYFKSNDAINRFLEFLMPDDLEFYAASHPDLFLSVPTTNGATEVLLPRNETLRRSMMEFLSVHRIAYRTSTTDFNSALEMHGQKLQKVHKYERIAKVTGYFPRYNEIQRWIRSLERAFPEIVSVEQIGRSFEGRLLYALKIGLSKNRHAPIIFIESGMHGREWLVPATCIWIIDQIVRAYAYDYRTPTLLHTRYNFVFVIVANPDGYEYSHSEDRLWRKTRSIRHIPVCADSSCSERVNITCIGVDGNRNWDAHFGEIGTSGDCKETYPGPHPFSEVEVQSLATYITSLKTKTRFYLSLHSSGQTWMIPPGFARNRLRNHVAQYKYATVATKAIRLAGGPNYTVGTYSELQYMVSGSSADWAIENDIPFAATVNLAPFWRAADDKAGSNSLLATAEEVENCGKYFHSALRALAVALFADSRV